MSVRNHPKIFEKKLDIIDRNINKIDKKILDDEKMKNKMKKVLLLVVVLFVSSAGKAQKIDYDKQEQNGDRTLGTSYVKFGSSFLGSGSKLFMVCVKDQNGLSIGITISLSSFVRKELSVGRKLLIKLDNDSILSLTNIQKITQLDNDYTIAGSVIAYHMYPNYEIKSDQLTTLMKHIVVKLRVETEDGYTDLDSRNFSKVVSKCYDTIQKRLSINNDLHNGF
jgi:hypothetical protein